MIKLLIFEKNKYICKNIINNMSISISEIKVTYIAYTIEETINILKNSIVDFIILGNGISHIDISKFIQSLINNNLEKYKKLIISFQKINASQQSLKENDFILYYFDEPINYKEVIKSINNYYLQKMKNEEIILKKISNELAKLHFKLSYHGTQYLIDCIYEIFLRKNKLDINLQKDIYPIIANKHKKAINTIHSNLKHTIYSMYLDWSILLFLFIFLFTYNTNSFI